MERVNKIEQRGYATKKKIYKDFLFSESFQLLELSLFLYSRNLKFTRHHVHNYYRLVAWERRHINPKRHGAVRQEAHSFHCETILEKQKFCG
jgi:hypothetical protein